MAEAGRTARSPRRRTSRTSSQPRRTQAERRRETRARILDACIDVLVERGFAGLTTTEVAGRAGVSRGALAHYFRTREALILAATEYLMDKGTRRAVAEADRARSSADPVERFVADAERFFFDRIYIAMMELLVAARTDRAFAGHYLPIVVKWRARINDIWLEVLVEAGLPRARARTVLQLSNNLMRGLALTSLWDDDPDLRRRLLGEWRKMLADAVQGENRERPRPLLDRVRN